MGAFVDIELVERAALYKSTQKSPELSTESCFCVYSGHDCVRFAVAPRCLIPPIMRQRAISS